MGNTQELFKNISLVVIQLFPVFFRQGLLHIPDIQLHTGEKHYREYVKNNFGNIFKQFLNILYLCGETTRVHSDPSLLCIFPDTLWSGSFHR